MIQGFLAFLGFALVGHPYAAAMGILSGVLNIIPVVGPSISAITASLIALFYSPMMAIWTMVVAMLSQNVTDNVIAPKINQSTMQVHPVLSLTALIMGSTLGGTMGMVIALPIAAVLKSLFIFYYETKTNKRISFLRRCPVPGDAVSRSQRHARPCVRCAGRRHVCNRVADHRYRRYA